MAVPVKHSMQFKVVAMTPEWAQELLDKNHPRNRKPKEKRIAAFARDMEQGYWRLTPEPICVDLSGYLTNGQNRLSAVIRANVEVPMCIVTGCPVESILGMDQGAARNVADTANIQGEPLPYGATNYAGAVRRMYAGLIERHMTTAEVLAFAKVHKAALDFAWQCMPKNIRGITQSPVRAVIARAYYKRNFRTRTREFCEVLQSGLPTDPQQDSGAIRLRNWLVDTFLGGARRQGKRRAAAIIVYAKTERALKAFHEGETIQSLIEMKRELFPLPSDADLLDSDDGDEDAEPGKNRILEVLNGKN